jgi:mRNA interferase RelE/StbE
MKIWKISTSKIFDKQINLLEVNDKHRIFAFFKKRVILSDNPKSLAKPLYGQLKGYWRFRVGDYRIIADIQDDVCTIVALEVGRRRDIYH